jgi:hypothetical protein
MTNAYSHSKVPMPRLPLESTVVAHGKRTVLCMIELFKLRSKVVPNNIRISVILHSDKMYTLEEAQSHEIFEL